MQVNETRGVAVFEVAEAFCWDERKARRSKVVAESVRRVWDEVASADVDHRRASRARSAEETEAEKEEKSSSVLFL